MSAISQKSISGITSITSPAGTDDQISLHTSNTNEALKIDGAGNLHLNNHVNTTGVTTASNFKTGSSNLHSTGLTVGDTFVHSTGINGSSADIDDFISVGSNIHLGNAGVVTATSFIGDGSDLTNLPAGLGTALSATASSPLNKMYYTNQVLGVPSSITVDVPASASKAYTQYADIKVDGSADLIVAEGDDLIPDILGLADFGTFGGGASAGRIRVNSISNAANDGSPTVQKGLVVTGVCTATSFAGNISGTTGTFGDFVDVGNNIQLGNAGVVTATTFVGNLTGNVNATSNLLLQIGGSEKFRVGSSGQLGIGGANYGTSGQVLTSGGSGSAATWSTVSGTTINNNANNRVITGSGTANTLEGESVLTFDSSTDTLQVHQQNNGNNPALKVIHRGGAGSQINAHFTNYSGTNHTVITHDGSIGIGTESPTEKFNLFGTNVKPVIGHKTDHTLVYSAYDTQNNTTLEISSSGTGTNVAGLTINNPTTSANTSYKSITFCCSATSNAEKRGAIITSNHDEDSSSTVKGNLSMMVNNGSGLQTALSINHDSYVTTPNAPSFHAVGMSGSSYDNGTMTGSGSGPSHNIGNHYNGSNGIFTAPVAGRYLTGCGVLVQSGSGRLEGHIAKNNSQTVANFNGTGTTYDGPVAVAVVQLAANDTLRVNRQSGNAYDSNHGQHYFFAHLIG